MINFNDNIRSALRESNHIITCIENYKDNLHLGFIEPHYEIIQSKIGEAHRFIEEITCLKTKLYVSEILQNLFCFYAQNETTELTIDIIKENLTSTIIPSIQAINRKIAKLSKKIMIQDIFDTFLAISRAIEKESVTQECERDIYTPMNVFIKKYKLK
jgi:hypothetical protein